jgi:hypothetical protein
MPGKPVLIAARPVPSLEALSQSCPPSEGAAGLAWQLTGPAEAFTAHAVDPASGAGQPLVARLIDPVALSHRTGVTSSNNGGGVARA